MTADRATARLALAASLALAACERSPPVPPRPATTEKPVQVVVVPDAAAPAQAVQPPAEPLLSEQELSPELRKLVDAAHGHRAVATLEAAGCDQALVMTGATYNRLADLRSAKKMPAPIADARADVVWCQRRTATPPDCAELAPIFARVARPKRPFEVFSGHQAPPDAPRCAGRHDRAGKLVHGEGPGYPPSR